jgi:single-strand DNA-binding protein
MASLNVGDPVIVQGRLRVRTETREGNTRTSADIDAVAIGHDLSRGTTAFRRSGRPEPGTATAPAQPGPAWESPAADPAGPAEPRQRPEAAAVT